MFFVYMLRSVKQPSVVQVSLTDNLDQVHEETLSGTNSIAGWLAPWELILTESYDTKPEAQKREAFLKAQKSYELPDYIDY